MLHIIKLIKNRTVNELYIFSFLITYWFFIWSSIGVEYKSILNFGKNFIELINFFRINIPLILSVISTFILIYIIFKKKIIKNYKNILILFYLYFFSIRRINFKPRFKNYFRKLFFTNFRDRYN